MQYLFLIQSQAVSLLSGTCSLNHYVYKVDGIFKAEGETVNKCEDI